MRLPLLQSAALAVLRLAPAAAQRQGWLHARAQLCANVWLDQSETLDSLKILFEGAPAQLDAPQCAMSSRSQGGHY